MLVPPKKLGGGESFKIGAKFSVYRANNFGASDESNPTNNCPRDVTQYRDENLGTNSWGLHL